MDTYELLRKMGLNATYKGYEIINEAVKLAKENHRRLCSIYKDIYTPLAKHLYYSEKTIERNIRTCAKLAFERNPELLNKLIGYKLSSPPNASQFIEALAMGKEKNER